MCTLHTALKQRVTVHQKDDLILGSSIGRALGWGQAQYALWVVPRESRATRLGQNLTERLGVRTPPQEPAYFNLFNS